MHMSSYSFTLTRIQPERTHTQTHTHTLTHSLTHVCTSRHGQHAQSAKFSLFAVANTEDQTTAAEDLLLPPPETTVCGYGIIGPSPSQPCGLEMVTVRNPTAKQAAALPHLTMMQWPRVAQLCVFIRRNRIQSSQRERVGFGGMMHVLRRHRLQQCSAAVMMMKSTTFASMTGAPTLRELRNQLTTISF